jgi:uncharacterized protein (DUF362 family)/NAD-dependent dihydropyrimidine dehydrogenase PreA subunit
MDKVAVVTSYDYDPEKLFKAVCEVLKKLDFKIEKNRTVLIKPNIMAQNKPNQHTVTHYAIIDALCNFLSQSNCRILIGDSIAFFQKGLTRKAFKTTKLADVALKYNAELVAFDEEPLVRVTKNLSVFKELYLPRKVLEADMIINACKLKTHGGGLRFSGALKNVFGCLPGGYKQKVHTWTKNDLELSDVFIDILKIIRPALHLMDAVIGLDGGPSAIGKPRPVGALLASRNPAALDVVASRMIGYEPEQIGILVRAKAKGLISDFKDIEVLGDPPRVLFRKLITTPLPQVKKKDGIFITHTFVYPRIKKAKCTRCQACLSFCPTGAIILNQKGEYKINFKQCIFCYFCLKACPRQAISIKSSVKNKIIRALRFVLGF